MNWTETTPINPTNLNNLETRIDQANTSVVTGKDNIYNAIIGKGVTPNTKEFANLVSAINAIIKGSGNAQQQHVLTPYTFTNDAGVPLQGTMANNGALGGTITQQNGSIGIPAGYTSGGSVTANISNLIPSVIKQNENVGGVIGTLVTDRLLQSFTESISFAGGNTYPSSIDCYARQLTADERAVRISVSSYYQVSGGVTLLKQDNGTWTSGIALIPGSGNNGRLELFVDSSNIVHVKQYGDSYAGSGYNMFSVSGSVTAWK